MADMSRYRLLDGTGVKAIPMESLPPEAWTPLDGSADSGSVSKLVSSVAFLYRCIDIRASAVSSVPWAILRGDTPVWESEDAGDPPMGAQYEWLASFPASLPRVEEALSIGSQAYLFKERAGARILRLRWLTPSTMKPEWTDDGITRYKRTLGGSKPPIWLAPEDVIYFWLEGLHETKPKESPANAALAAAGVLHNADLFAKQFFERGAIKASILAVPQTTQRKDKEELESWFGRAMTGISKAWSSKAINADAVTVIPIGEGLESLNNKALTESMREDIATAMGVPHSLVLSNAANFATAEVDEMGFFTRCIIPECIRIQQTLNEQLFTPLGLRFQFKPQELSIMQEDEEQRSMSLLHYVQAGVPLPVALDVLGVHLPDDVDPSTWAAPAEPEPEPEADPMAAFGLAARTQEIERFKRWAKRRMGNKAFDPDAFESSILDSWQKAALVSQLREGGDADDAFFPVTGWENYP